MIIDQKIAETESQPQILQVAIPDNACYQLFDYLPPEDVDSIALQAGMRLEVPFGLGNRKKIAYLIAVTNTSAFSLHKLKQVERIIDQRSLLSSTDIALLQWASRYYHHPLGDVIQAAFPVLLRQGKVAELSKKATGIAAKIQAPQVQLLCNDYQQAAIDAVLASIDKFGVFLLEGITGSGKTEVYMQIIQQVLQKGQQVLVLVPEITLTPQLQHRFEQRFAIPIAIFHSRLTNNQRFKAWLQMQRGEHVIMLGTRSSLFTPLKNLGLIILDEEHDSSFKQQEGLRFSARDVAIIRAKLANIPILLGSATPSLESLQNCARGRYHWLHLPERAGNALPPKLQLLDIRSVKMQEGLSAHLLAEMHVTLAKGEQVLLFINRRGFAPTLICHTCGWVARCLGCDANLVIHSHAVSGNWSTGSLCCHHCQQQQALLTKCPACQKLSLTALGLGTERIEQELARVFIDRKIVRLDFDSTKRKGSLEVHLEQINQGQVDIIIGTQMLAKGHHFPEVTLVALLDVDSGLFSIDFHATEKLAQLITQVAGRAGRADKQGKVILQTRCPEHPLLNMLINEGYTVFAQAALKERQQALLPPFSYQVLLRAEGKNSQLSENFLHEVAGLAETFNQGNTQVLGPIAAPMARRADFYRFQLLLQNSNRAKLHELLTLLVAAITTLKSAKKVRWSLDVDPVDLF